MYYTGGPLNYHCTYFVSREEGVAGAQQEQAGDQTGGRHTPYTGKREKMLGKDDTIIHLNYNNCKNRPTLTIEEVRLLPVKPSIHLGSVKGIVFTTA